MNQKHSFVISRFTNPSGEVVFRVYGYLDGKRVRKNVPTRADAESERQILEIQRLQSETGMRATATRLTEDQLQEAEAAFRRLGDKPFRSLPFCVDYALQNYREPVARKALSEAAAEYLADKTAQRDRGLLSTLQLRNIANGLRALKARFPDATMADFTPAMLATHLECGLPALKTYNNRRGILSTFFKFAVQKDWIEQNPIERTAHHRISRMRGSATTMTAEAAADLMAGVEQFQGGVMVPYFALCLFAGIRPCVRSGEITRLKAESVQLDTGFIHIEPRVSKVRDKRMVSIQPNLAEWLRAFPLRSFPIMPINSEDMRGKLFRRFGLTHDVLRHTYISMFVGKFRSLGEAALQAGNSESIIRKHYLNLKNPAEAERFWSIVPARIKVEGIGGMSALEQTSGGCPH